MRLGRKAYYIPGRQPRAGGLSMMPRRRMLGAFVASAAGFSLSRLSSAAVLPPTPAQTAGPFYPLALPPDSDNDLIHIAGRDGKAKGTVTYLSGRVLDPDGGRLSAPGSRSGNATPTAAITMSGTTAPVRHS